MSEAALPAGMGLAVNRSYAWKSLGNHLVGDKAVSEHTTITTNLTSSSF